MPLLKNSFLEKNETWHIGLSCQYTHFMSFSSKSEHDTVADQATLMYSCFFNLTGFRFDYMTAEQPQGTDYQYAYNPCVGFTDPDSSICSNVAVSTI